MTARHPAETALIFPKFGRSFRIDLQQRCCLPVAARWRALAMQAKIAPGGPAARVAADEVPVWCAADPGSGVVSQIMAAGMPCKR